MLVNPTYGAGGSPTPTSGYVEDGLNALYDGTSGSLELKNAIYTAYPNPTDKKYQYNIYSNDGMTIECYAQVDGDSSTSYSRAFEAGISDSLVIGFGNGGGSSNSDYRYNPMSFMGGSFDYDIFVDGLTYGDKHTFSIVSTPDPEETASNVVSFYIDGIQVGETKTMNRDAYAQVDDYSVEGVASSRAMNGTVHSGRFYTRALTAADLAANHANDIALYGGNT